MPMKPAFYQNKLDRFNTMAERRPLSQAQQQTVKNLQNRLGMNNEPRAPQDTGMPKATPMVSPQASNIQTLGKLNPNFGDTRVPNVNTIGMAAPTGGMLPAGGGGVAAPGTEGTVNAPLPPGATYKKGGKVNSAKYMSYSKAGKTDGMKSVTKMASGGSASKRGDGIAQRGKTKGRMC